MEKQAKEAELWWLTPLIHTQGKQKQAVVCEFETSQGYTKEPCLRKKKIIKQVSDFEAFRIFR